MSAASSPARLRRLVFAAVTVSAAMTPCIFGSWRTYTRKPVTIWAQSVCAWERVVSAWILASSAVSAGTSVLTICSSAARSELVSAPAWVMKPLSVARLASRRWTSVLQRAFSAARALPGVGDADGDGTGDGEDVVAAPAVMVPVAPRLIAAAAAAARRRVRGVVTWWGLPRCC